MSPRMLSEVSQGFVDARVEAGGFRVEMGHHRPFSRHPVHSHEQANLLYVLGGEFEQTIDGTPFAGRPGTTLAKPGGVPHSDRYGRSPALALYIEVLPPRLTEVRRDLDLLHGVSCRAHPAARPAALRLAAATRRAKEPRLLVEALILELLVALGAPPRPGSENEPDATRHAVELLDENLGDPPGLDDLAAAVNLPARHLLTAFRARFGESPGEFVRRRRLERAAQRLVLGRDAIATIAADLGFADQAHLTRAFRAAYGSPPGTYRRRVSIEHPGDQDSPPSN